MPAKREVETVPFSARISVQCREEMKWVAATDKCSQREAMEQAMHAWYQRRYAYTSVMRIGTQELKREEQLV